MIEACNSVYSVYIQLFPYVYVYEIASKYLKTSSVINSRLGSLENSIKPCTEVCIKNHFHCSTAHYKLILLVPIGCLNEYGSFLSICVENTLSVIYIKTDKGNYTL